jgi:vacuolar-type H+-ATPase subunit I/STV1
LKPVLEKLKKQDEARDKLMDEAIEISDEIHRVRHLLINVKAETNGIQTHDDGDWIFTNPFGKNADAPAQDVAPFQKQVKDLQDKSKKINENLKKLVEKTHKARNDAIELDASLYGEIQKAKHIVADANKEIRHHFDRVEMFNHKDYDIIHPVDAKLNDVYRVDRHRFNGMINLANAMSARQPGEVSEVTALATDLLIVNAEGEERLKRMQDVIDSIKFERGFREEGSGSK